MSDTLHDDSLLIAETKIGFNRHLFKSIQILYRKHRQIEGIYLIMSQEYSQNYLFLGDFREFTNLIKVLFTSIDKIIY